MAHRRRPARAPADAKPSEKPKLPPPSHFIEDILKEDVEKAVTATKAEEDLFDEKEIVKLGGVAIKSFSFIRDSLKDGKLRNYAHTVKK